MKRPRPTFDPGYGKLRLLTACSIWLAKSGSGPVYEFDTAQRQRMDLAAEKARLILRSTGENCSGSRNVGEPEPFNVTIWTKYESYTKRNPMSQATTTGRKWATEEERDAAHDMVRKIVEDAWFKANRDRYRSQGRNLALVTG